MRPETLTFYELAVQNAALYVAANLDAALDLEALARRAALSPFHFHRIFRGLLGETPLELHRRLRMERAAWTLRESDAPVTRIAFDAGYETHESFTRAFRSEYHCSPSEFRSDRPGDGAGCARPRQYQLPARSGVHFSPEKAAPVVSFARFQKGEGTMNVNIENMPEMRVATVTHVGPYNQISEAFGRLGAIADGSDLFGPETAMLGIYFDDPETTPPAELRSEAGLVVSSRVKLPRELGERRLPAGQYAHTTHHGSYERLGDAWARFMGEWLPQSGRRMPEGSVSYEIYKNTPADVPQDQLVTELYIPLSEPNEGAG